MANPHADPKGHVERYRASEAACRLPLHRAMALGAHPTARVCRPRLLRVAGQPDDQHVDALQPHDQVLRQPEVAAVQRRDCHDSWAMWAVVRNHGLCSWLSA